MNRLAASVTITTATLAFMSCDTSRPTGPSATPAATETELLAASANERVTTGGADITFAVGLFDERWSFEAKRVQDVVDPTAATGEFQVTARVLGELVTHHGDILCFSIDGNQAHLAGKITHSNQVGAEEDIIIWSVEDNGEGKNSPPDQATALKLGLTTHCAMPVAPDYLTVKTGNVQVHK